MQRLGEMVERLEGAMAQQGAEIARLEGENAQQGTEIAQLEAENARLQGEIVRLDNDRSDNRRVVGKRTSMFEEASVFWQGRGGAHQLPDGSTRIADL